MKILTSREMKTLDRRTIEEIGIPGPVLMENAGLRILEALEDRFDPACETVVIVAGKGNNGGDGLVVARHLLDRGGPPPQVLLLAARGDVRGDAAVNLRAAVNMGIPVTEIRSEADWPAARPILAAATIIVDALFGTGLQDPLAGLFARVVEDINAAEAFVLAVDVPSGLSADTAEIIGPCVRADLTVALAAPKIAHVFPPAEECVGELVIAPIGIPAGMFDDPALRLELLLPPMVAPLFAKRTPAAHKGTFGHLLAVAGSLGKTGAAGLAGKAALKMGAGLVTVATPASCVPMVARVMPELMTEALPETPAKTIAREAVPRVLELLRGRDALLLGPGLSTDPGTAEFVLELLPRVDKPMVIDADGLNIIAGGPDVLGALRAPAVLTPHPGEFGRLTGLSASEVLRRRLELAPEFAARRGVHLVLKGYRTLTCAPDGRVAVNPTGNPGLASGGTGDVLAGMIGAEIMQSGGLFERAAAAVFAHGLCGDFAAGKTGERALTAGDLIRVLPRVLKSLEEG